MIRNTVLPKDLEKAMMEPARGRLIEHVRQAFRVESSPESMLVTSIHRPAPLLEIRLTPEGQLAVRYPERNGAGAAHLDIQLEKNLSEHNWWSVLQMRTMLIDEAILTWAREENPDGGKELDQDWGWRKQMIRMALSVQDGIRPEAAREQLDRALQTLVDPETFRRAAREKTPVNLGRYNIAAMGASAMRELRSRTPGALAWVMENPREIARPADILEAFREDMIHAGIPENHLADLAALDRTFIRKICAISQASGRKTGEAGLILGAVGRICETWKEEQPQDPGWLEDTAAQLHSMLKRDQQRHWAPRDTILNTLVKILEPQAHQTASAFRSRVGVAQYRLASLGGQEIRRLRRTNPGVICWAMEHVTPEDRIVHPGEIINLVREDMTQLGLEARAWKTFSQTPEALTRSIARNLGRTRTAATFMNAMARCQARPTPGLVRNLEFLKIWDSMQKDAEIPLGLIFRESQRRLQEKPGNRAQDELAQECYQAWDYCRAMNIENRRVGSTTFAGLMKRSREWHRQITWEKLQDEWTRTMKNQNGLHHAWNSLLETPIGLDDLTVVHLGSQRDLFIESREMHHCIHSYTDRCLSGYSRIFSILRGGKKIATGEITREGQSWKATQTRGVLNGEAPREIQQAMDMVAIRYSREWDRNPQHTRWMLAEPACLPGR